MTMYWCRYCEERIIPTAYIRGYLLAAVTADLSYEERMSQPEWIHAVSIASVRPRYRRLLRCYPRWHKIFRRTFGDATAKPDFESLMLYQADQVSKAVPPPSLQPAVIYEDELPW